MLAENEKAVFVFRYVLILGDLNRPHMQCRRERSNRNWAIRLYQDLDALAEFHDFAAHDVLSRWIIFDMRDRQTLDVWKRP
jgi:hypothetical protein